MNHVLHRVASAHIVNINGAPGFGKSTLVIHVGYEILKNGSSVRYINIEDKVFSIVYEHQKSKRKAISEGIYKAHQTHQSSLIELSRSSLSSLTSQILSSRNENLFEELLRWSESINCTSVLILDNCDDILITSSRHKFLSLINSLVIKSSFKLHVIIVSRERLLYLDSFDHWTVRELNQSASIQLLDKLAPAFDNESLREVAELVEGCPLALKVIGQLLHINGAQLFHKLKKEFLTTLDKVSVSEQRFRVILDVAFNRLGTLKDCGYVLSLFPGSFGERAGSAIVHNECLETYLKHSLLNEYSFAFNHRYKMHRVIKEYLQEKIFIGKNSTFIAKFREYFEAMLLTYVIQEEIDDTEKYTLSLELHNLHYLRELLLSEMHFKLSSEELATLAFLFDIKLIELEQLQKYYAYYVKKVHEVCPLLNQKLCGQMYANIVRNLYRQCKCKTLSKYLQFFLFPLYGIFPVSSGDLFTRLAHRWSVACVRR